MNIGRYLPAFLKLIHQHDLPASLVELGWWNFQSQETPGEPPLWPRDLGGPDLQVKHIEFSFSLNLFPRKQTSLAGKSPFWKGIHIDSFRVGFFPAWKNVSFPGCKYPKWGNFGFWNMSIPKPFLWNKQKRSIDLRQPSHVMCWRFTRFRGGEIESWNPLWLRFWEMMNF